MLYGLVLSTTTYHGSRMMCKLGECFLWVDWDVCVVPDITLFSQRVYRFPLLFLLLLLLLFPNLCYSLSLSAISLFYTSAEIL